MARRTTKKTTAKKATNSSVSIDTSNMNILGIIAWLLGLVGAIIVLIMEKKDKVAIWHAKQSLVVGIIFFVIWIFFYILSLLPMIWIIATIFNTLLSLGYLIIIVIGIIFAAQNKTFDIPIIADIAKKVNF